MSPTKAKTRTAGRRAQGAATTDRIELDTVAGDDANGPSRTRTTEWLDPMIGAAWARQMSGMDYLRAMRDGRVPPPPVGLLLGMEAPVVHQGRASISLPPGEHLYNPIGTVHGGMLAALLDSTMGCAVHSTLRSGVGYATVDMSMSFVRPVTVHSPTLRCEGEVVHAGRTIITARGRITDDTGALYATASSTSIVLRGAS